MTVEGIEENGGVTRRLHVFNATLVVWRLSTQTLHFMDTR